MSVIARSPQPPADAAFVLYTRCTNCHEVLPLAPADLAQAGGIVRCGSCGRTLNALSMLYAYPPQAGTEPIASDGMPPLLTPRVEQTSILAAHEDGLPVLGDDSADRQHQSSDAESGPILDFSPPKRSIPEWLRWFWPALCVLMIVLLLLQLFGPEAWRVNWSGLSSVPVEQLPLDQAVQVVSRDLHPHPSLNDAVVISAVLVNRAEQTVRWPEIEIRLFDASQQVIGERRLQPQEYLTIELDESPGFRPDERLPIVLEMVTEASVATGFSLAFY